MVVAFFSLAWLINVQIPYILAIKIDILVSYIHYAMWLQFQINNWLVMNILNTLQYISNQILNSPVPIKGGGGAKFSPNCLKNFPSFEPMPITSSNKLWGRKRHFSTVYFLQSQALFHAICRVNLSDQKGGGGEADKFVLNKYKFSSLTISKITSKNKRNSIAFLSKLRERGRGSRSLLPS